MCVYVESDAYTGYGYVLYRVHRHTDILRTDVQMYSGLVGDRIEDCVSQGKQRQTPYVDEEEFLSSSPIIIIIAIIIHAVRTKL